MGLIKRAVKRKIRQKIRTPVKRKIRQQARRVSFTCPRCGKRYVNRFAHTCVIKTDFKKRKRAAEARAKRAAAAAKRKAQRERAAQRRREAASRRRAAATARRQAARARMRTAGPPGQHSYRACRDEDCERYACRVYREGVEAGETR